MLTLFSQGGRWLFYITPFNVSFVSGQPHLTSDASRLPDIYELNKQDPSHTASIFWPAFILSMMLIAGRIL